VTIVTVVTIFSPSLRTVGSSASRVRRADVHTGFDVGPLIAAGFPALGRRFLLWRLLPPRKAGKKPIKLPCSSSGRGIDSTDERLWLDFDTAVRIATRQRYGLGVAIGWGLGGLDLDECIDAEGVFTRKAATILRHFPTFTEISPSGTGCKAYFLTSPFITVTKKEEHGVELYGGLRWFALTGRTLSGSVPTIADCTESARALARVLRPPKVARYRRTVGTVSGNALARLREAGSKRERPSHLGGVLHTLIRCPFTGEEHDGGGPWAIVFTDGGVLFRCDRSAHGAMREWAGKAPAALRDGRLR
jgi:hypothetical protein